MKPETSAVDPLRNGLPANLDAERLLLGSILLDGGVLVEKAAALQPGDFSLDKHQIIFRRMVDIHERGETVDRIVLANELKNHNELDSVDGLSYLISLDDGLPRLPNLNGYVKIVRVNSALRKMCYISQAVMNRCMTRDGEPGEILEQAERLISELRETIGSETRRGWRTPAISSAIILAG